MNRWLPILVLVTLLSPVATASAQFAPPEPKLVERDYVFEGLDRIPGRTFVLTYERRNLFFTKVVTNGSTVEPFDRVIWPDGRGAPGVMLYAIRLGDDGKLPDEITPRWLRQADCVSLAIHEKLDGVVHPDPAQPLVVKQHVTYRITLSTEGDGEDEKEVLSMHLARIVGEDANGNVVVTRRWPIPGEAEDNNRGEDGDDSDGDQDDPGTDDDNGDDGDDQGD